MKAESRKLDRAFYERDALTVARELLGKTLVRKTPEGETRGIIVETEGYLGERDDAAHVFKGKSERTRVAYEGGGLAYVYLIYGMYCCFNITANVAGVPEMVLIRALEPTAGTDVMYKRRPKARKDKDLCSGPGKLCQAMDISRELYGMDLVSSGEFYVEDAPGIPDERTAVTPRINIDYAEQCREEPWRFVIKDSRYLSVKL